MQVSEAYRVDFLRLPWEVMMPGVRHKYIDRAGVRLRIVEYTPEQVPTWCTKSHFGQWLDGRFEIKFTNHTEIFEAGDGVHIPGGETHRHMGRCLTETATALFVEKL